MNIPPKSPDRTLFFASAPLLKVVSTGLFVGFAGSLLATAGGTLFIGWGYFLASPEAQSEHELHSLLGAGAPLGVALGFLGTALMLAMLLYTVRKYLARVEWLGPLPAWLRFHIVCGVMGPVMILLHAGLSLPRGLVAVAFWCMVLVALSGGFGRYIYSFFPRSAAGRHTDLTRSREALAALRGRLVESTASVRGAQIGALVHLARDLEQDVGGLGDLVRLDREVRRRKRKVVGLLAELALEPTQREEAKELIFGQLGVGRSLATWEVSRKFFRYWHLFHQPLARAMYLLIAVHVGTSLLFGGAVQNLLQLFP